MSIVSEEEFRAFVQKVSQSGSTSDSSSLLNTVVLEGELAQVGDSDDVKLLSGSVLFIISPAKAVLSVTPKHRSDGVSEVRLRVRKDANIVMEAAIDAEDASEFLTGDSVFEVHKNGVRSIKCECMCNYCGDCGPCGPCDPCGPCVGVTSTTSGKAFRLSMDS